jgi:serine/threonine protein kinase
MTPEVLSGVDLKASTAQDIWAIGILTYQLLVGKVPFDSEVNNLKAIKNDIITKPV